MHLLDVLFEEDKSDNFISGKEKPLQFRSEDPRYSGEEDNSTLKITDTRKTRLTLAHINKLRLMNEVRQLEKQEKLKAVKKQYGAPPPEAAGGLGI